MIQFRHFIRRLIVENYLLKAGSFLLALILWFYVQNQGKIEKSVDLQVKQDSFVVAPDTKDVKLFKVSTDVINVRMKGLPSAMVNVEKHARLSIELPREFADLGRESIFELRNGNIQDIPLGAEILSISPGSITAMLDYVMEKEVDVEINLIGGHPLEGYVVASQSVEPKQVRIIGPRSIVKNQSKILTELTYIGKNKVTYTQRTALILPSKEVICSPVFVNITFDIQEIVETKDYDRLPIRVKTIRGSDTMAEIDPQFLTVTVEGTHNDLKTLTPDKVKVVLDVQELPAEKWRSMTPRVEFPPEYGNRPQAINFKPRQVNVRVFKNAAPEQK